MTSSSDNNKKRKQVSLTTPLGVFAYPSLHKIDYGTEEYPCVDGRYKVRLILNEDDPATKDFISKCQSAYDEAIAEAELRFAELPVASRKKLKNINPQPILRPVFDKETEKPTGQVELNAVLPAKVTYKKGPKAGQTVTNKIVVFDSKGNRMHPVPDIWGGTEGKLNVSIRPYFVTASGDAGISFRLNAAMIKKLIGPNGDRSADSFGFETNEDGYEYTPPEEEAFSKSGANTNDGEDNGDF